MLKYRLFFGTLMTVFFIAVVILDGWLDGSLTASAADDKPVEGTLFCIFIAALIIPAQFELAKLAAAKGVRIFIPVSTTASILFATIWYWPQVLETSPKIYLLLLSAFSLLALLLYQYIHYGTSAVLANCGANYFSIIYLGLLSAFCLAIRIDFGPWVLLMFVFVVKCSDIGAYAVGMLFGKHKFSPNIGIFGFCFAFIGQFGDLAESMIKRDAEQKDAASKVPGFGGILDIVDSPLLAAPLAYLFFMLSSR